MGYGTSWSGVFSVDMTIQPKGNRILVQPREGEAVSAGGIHIPEQSRTTGNNRSGIIVALGDGERGEDGERVPITDVKEGEEVMYGSFAGTKLRLHNEDFVMLKLTEVVGVLEREDDRA